MARIMVEFSKAFPTDQAVDLPEIFQMQMVRSNFVFPFLQVLEEYLQETETLLQKESTEEALRHPNLNKEILFLQMLSLELPIQFPETEQEYDVEKLARLHEKLMTKVPFGVPGLLKRPDSEGNI